MLHYDCGVRNKGPEVIREETWIALKVGEEGGRVGIIIRI